MKKSEITELVNYITSQNNDPDNDRKTFKFITNTLEKLCDKSQSNLIYPARVLWKITGICNCRCQHCWATLGHQANENDLLRVAKELSENHVATVSLSGGEPLLCKSLFKIYKELKRNNAIVEILTNGSLITEEWINEYEQVADKMVDVIQISLDGSISEIHDYQRDLPIFDKVINSIKMLKARNIKIRVSFTATKENQNDIYNTYKLCNQLGVNVMSITPVFPLRKGKLIVSNLDESIYLEQILLCKKNEGKTKTRIQVGFKFQNEILENLSYNELLELIKKNPYPLKYLMYETNSSMQIDAYGNAIPGPEYESVHCAGNVYDSSVGEVWNKAENWSEFRRARDLTNTKCAQCLIYSICGGGNAKLAYDRYGTINAPDGRCNW